MPGLTWVSILGGGIWLFKISISKLMDRSIEMAKSELVKILDRDKLVFGEIYKNRVSVLVELYKLLSGIIDDTRYLVQNFYVGSSPDPEELSTDIVARLDKINRYIRDNAIYIPDNIEEKALKLAHGVFWSINKYITAKKRQEKASRPDQFDRYYSSEDQAVAEINGEITDLMKTMKAEIKTTVTDMSNLAKWG